MAPEQNCDNPSCRQKEPSRALQRCSRCRRQHYCSRECQTAAWPAHKKDCRRPNYIFKVHLAPGGIQDPPITRTFSCMAEADFYRLHMVLQVVFGWVSTHSFDFAIKDPEFRSPAGGDEREGKASTAASQGGAGSPREHLLRLVDPGRGSVFGGPDQMQEARRKHPDTPERPSEKVELWEIFDDPSYQDKEIVYTYDFGACWEHYITVEGRDEPTEECRALDGTGHGVAEEVGGVQGWEELKAAYRTKDPSPEQLRRRKWYETEAQNWDEGGLAGDRVNAWGRDRINNLLQGNKFLERFMNMADPNLTESQLQAILSVVRTFT